MQSTSERLPILAARNETASRIPILSVFVREIWNQVFDAGLLPWIPLWMISSYHSLGTAALEGFGLAVFVLVVNYARMRHFKSCTSPPLNCTPSPEHGLPLGYGLHLPPWQIWPKYFDVATAVMLLVIFGVDRLYPDAAAPWAVGPFQWGPSALAIWVSFPFEPFTVQYAKESVPAIAWDHPAFLDMNRKISFAWGVAMTVATLSSSVCPATALVTTDKRHKLAAELYALCISDSGGTFAAVTSLYIPCAALVAAIWFTSWLAKQSSGEAVSIERPFWHRYKEGDVAQDRPVFFGDSDIEYWDTARAFPTALNCGVGGATAVEVARHAQALCARCRPKGYVVLVCGENDLACTDDVDRVFEATKAAVQIITTSHHRPRVIMLGTKPEPATRELHEKYQRYDTLLRAHADAARLGSFAAGEKPPFMLIDSFSRFLDIGNARTLYRSDGLHLSEQGYGHWEQWVRDELGPGTKEPLR